MIMAISRSMNGWLVTISFQSARRQRKVIFGPSPWLSRPLEPGRIPLTKQLHKQVVIVGVSIN